ncbi:MAG: hypothetical protein CO183_01660 [Candidatus Zambryskibacteria bacterium CG_4_9_14_3_um_filter_42_9]|uniref:Uncharacterized protein n=1 Tax=Candidatus Zambryskibacteria bacterium CG22_combo_CG10-13_8_21_14_all_42_17 TaxID=1975118 RepID=A0A2H0BCV7_9BACT|nr:MAG: hypothetical protein COX06_03115 [Candidatus Zambryskibacteria bacterium CG22_combo_CG10-13_8_21_14_all_42_17]PJA36773.1 MAG: hypothetical protein CO183_01660 [Candidatus Zambryskibacteria bacterium CG_4_9_14_3_um_filter_42_9]
MEKHFSLTILCVLVLIGYMVPSSISSREREAVPLQRGIRVQVTHTCTEYARIYQAGVDNLELILEIMGVTPMTIAFEPAFESDRWITLTLQSMQDGKVVGTYITTFSLEYGDSTIVRSWYIGNNFSGGGGGYGHWSSPCRYSY